MKRILTIVLAAAAFFAAENTADAQLLKNIAKAVENSTESTTKNESQALTSGQAAGKALKALYTQYKKDGKLNLKNLTNLTNLTTLSTCIEDLKGMDSKSAFYKDFAKGLMNGSDNLVNNSNVSNVMKLLKGSSGDDTKTGKVGKTAETVIGILKLFADKE